jgi:hypothetical protein
MDIIFKYEEFRFKINKIPAGVTNYNNETSRIAINHLDKTNQYKNVTTFTMCVTRYLTDNDNGNLTLYLLTWRIW